MSVNKTLLNRTITLALNGGTNAEGSAVVKNRTFNCINPSATAGQMYNTATKLGTLMDDAVSAVYCNEKSELAEEAE